MKMIHMNVPGHPEATLEGYILDCELSLGQSQDRPAVVVCPGGGYRRVSQREGEPIALHFLPHGYNVFVLWYSVSPNRFPTQLREVAAAMELLHENAEAWHCDTDKIAIMGFSAGGHLAAHYSNAYHWPEVREMFPRSKPGSATLLCYPVMKMPAWKAISWIVSCPWGRKLPAPPF